MSLFTRKPKNPNAAAELGTTKAQLAALQCELETVKRAASDEVAALNAEAVETARATQAMADAHHRELEHLQRRIANFIDLRDSQRSKLAHQRLQLADKQAELDRALNEIRRLDAELGSTVADLAHEREDHRAFRRKWAGHLNQCPTAAEIHEEDIAKTRKR